MKVALDKGSSTHHKENAQILTANDNPTHSDHGSSRPLESR